MSPPPNILGVMSFRMSTRVTANVICCTLMQILCVVSKKLQLLGTSSPRSPTRAPPLDPAGGLPSPSPPVFFYVPPIILWDRRPCPLGPGIQAFWNYVMHDIREFSSYSVSKSPSFSADYDFNSPRNVRAHMADKCFPSMNFAVSLQTFVTEDYLNRANINNDAKYLCQKSHFVCVYVIALTAITTSCSMWISKKCKGLFRDWM